MAKPPKKPKPEDIEAVPDAWERFEKTIDTVTQSGPKPSRKKGGTKGSGNQG